MAPTESSILTNFLLSPAPLPAFLTLSEFTALFPASLQSNPQIRYLYASIQHQRSRDADQVRLNIEEEAKRGEKVRRQITRTRRAEADAAIPSNGDIMMGEAFDGPMDLSTVGIEAGRRKQHSPSSMIAELEAACEYVQKEVDGMEEDEKKLLEEMRGRVGELSDLRYGRLGKLPGGGKELGEEVVEELKVLEEQCQGISSR
ncbi:MAG: hypothetical protein M1834_003171 [Cirrosporium novae-zelandiae]|nr:MAG: hypothetical protein M1834_003171 [Cirrosporium novae-zelandiae]